MFILFQQFIFKILYIYLLYIILRNHLFNKIQLILTIINEIKKIIITNRILLNLT